MLNYYYDLKNPSVLPPRSKFVDPYDFTTFESLPNESLSGLLQRINQTRSQKSYPTIIESELRFLVLTSLYQSTPEEDREKFFERRVLLPMLSQIASLATALVTQSSSRHTVTPKQREERANKCLSNCRFHQREGGWSNSAKTMVGKLIGIQNIAISKSEEKLGNCLMCGGCALQKKVHLENISALASLTPEKLDNLLRVYGQLSFDKCWIVNEALKHPTTRDLLKKKLQNGQADGLHFFKLYMDSKVAEARKHGK